MSSRFFDITSYIFYKNNISLETVQIPFKLDINNTIKLLKQVKWKILQLQEYNTIFIKLKKNIPKNILINIDKLSY